MANRLLTPKTLAALYGIGITKTRELMHTESFPSFKIDGKYYVHPERAEEYFKNATGTIDVDFVASK